MCKQHLRSHAFAAPVSQPVSQSVSQQLSAELIKDVLDSFLMKIETCHSRLKQPLCVLVISVHQPKPEGSSIVYCICFQDFHIKFQSCNVVKMGH